MDEYEILNKVLKKYRYKISEEEYPTIEFIGKHDLPWGLLILILLIILQIFLQKGITIIKLISIICVGSLLFLRMRDRSKIGKFNLSVKKFEILNSGLLITNFLNIQTLVHKDRFPNLEVIEFEDSADDIVLGFTEYGSQDGTMLMFSDKKSEDLTEAFVVIAQFATDIWNDE